MRLALTVAALAALSVGAAANAAVFRCTAADGGITYQDAPCAGADAAQATDIPTQFPPVNEAERARILQREAELEARLAARRERESREAAMRLAAAPAPTPAPAEEAVYPLYAPLYPPVSHLRPHPPRGPRPTPHARGITPRL